MEKFNRAVRRHHVARLKNTRKHYWGFGHVIIQDKTWGGEIGTRGRNEMTPKQLGTVIQNPTVCSGGCCGNERKWQGMSLKEACWHALADTEMKDL